MRTRFAPSPTGTLHLGGARTALFCYLLARHNHGSYLLRIEDTDSQRSTDAHIQTILASLDWLGIHSDEAVVYQSQNKAKHLAHAHQLLADGAAYYCDCSSERLDALRVEQMANKQKPRYDGKCRARNLAVKPNTVIRFATPQTGSITFVDGVAGETSYNNAELDDLVIVRSDGQPTYNLSVVLDDHAMAITDVIRGSDHINNTPRQLHIYRAFGYAIPRFTHLPLINDENGKKLSKRQGAQNVLEYRDKGYLPAAMNNFLARLGWSYGDQEIFQMDELIALFGKGKLNRAAAAFSTSKLDWVNRQHLLSLQHSAIAAQLSAQYSNVTQATLAANLPPYLERANTLNDIAEGIRPLYHPVTQYNAAALKHMTLTNRPVLLHLHTQLQQLTSWDAASIKATMQTTMEALNCNMGKVGMPLRAALTGRAQSPAVDWVAATLGQQHTLQRLQAAIEFIDKNSV